MVTQVSNPMYFTGTLNHEEIFTCPSLSTHDALEL